MKMKGTGVGVAIRITVLVALGGLGSRAVAQEVVAEPAVAVGHVEAIGARTPLTMAMADLPDSPVPAVAVKVATVPRLTKRFWIMGTVDVIAAGADFWTTRQGLNAGMHESNPILGEHPSNVAMAAMGSVEQILNAYLGHYADKRVQRAQLEGNKADERVWRVMSYLPQAVSSFVHVKCAIDNYKLAH